MSRVAGLNAQANSACRSTLRLGRARLLGGEGDGDGDQGLGDRPAGDRGQVRPLGLGVGAGVLVPGDHLVPGGLGVGQAGARAEGPPVADRVLEAVEEPVGEGRGLERLAVLAPVDGPPDPVPCRAAVAELLDVPEPDVVTVHLLLAPVRLACLPGGAATRVSALRRTRTPPPGSRTDRRPGSLPAPAVERGPGHPQLGGHLLDRQQRVARGTGCFGRGGGGRPGAVGVPGGGPSVGPRRRTLRSARRVKSGPRRPGGRQRSGAAGPGNGERGKAPRRAARRSGAGRARPCRRGRPAGAGAGWSRAVTSCAPSPLPGAEAVGPDAGRRGALACRPGPQASSLHSARPVKSARARGGLDARPEPRSMRPARPPGGAAGRPAAGGTARGHGGAHRDGARHRRPHARPARRPGTGTPGCAQRVMLTEGSVIGRSLTPPGFPSTTEIGFSGPFFARHPEKGASEARKHGCCCRDPLKMSVVPRSCRWPCRLSRLLVGGRAIATDGSANFPALTRRVGSHVLADLCRLRA